MQYEGVSIFQYIGTVHRVSACHVDQFDHLNHNPHAHHGGQAERSEQEEQLAQLQAVLDGAPPVHAQQDDQHQAEGDRSISKERDVALKRDVVVLKKLAWVHFR